MTPEGDGEEERGRWEDVKDKLPPLHGACSFNNGMGCTGAQIRGGESHEKWVCV